SYRALFAAGIKLADGPDDFAKGARLVLQAALQSPNFVYRVERSQQVVAGRIPLDGYEIATKLSYMLWNTMPDERLFAAAETGSLTLPQGILQEAERMLDDDRARPMVAWFHHQLYQFDYYDDLSKDPELFPDFLASLGADMKEEAEHFIDDI